MRVFRNMNELGVIGGVWPMKKVNKETTLMKINHKSIPIMSRG